MLVVDPAEPRGALVQIGLIAGHVIDVGHLTAELDARVGCRGTRQLDLNSQVEVTQFAASPHQPSVLP